MIYNHQDSRKGKKELKGLFKHIGVNKAVPIIDPKVLSTVSLSSSLTDELSANRHIVSTDRCSSSESKDRVPKSGEAITSLQKRGCYSVVGFFVNSPHVGSRQIMEEDPLTLSTLPDDILLHILLFLTKQELGTVSSLCHRFLELTDCEGIWQDLCLTEKGVDLIRCLVAQLQRTWL